MPPVTSPGSPDRMQRRSPVPDRAARVRFRRAIALMLMTLFVPGSAQLMAGNRRIGLIAIRIWGALLAGLVLALVVSYGWRGFAYWMVSNTMMLGLFQLLLMAVAVGWFALFMDAWRIGQPLTLAQGQRLAMVGVNGLLCFSVAGTLLFGAHMISVQRDFIGSMFGGGTASNPNDGRYNVLLLGGDSGADRWGLRPDSITVASIDEETGRTILFGLPRNLANFPFKKGSVMAKQFPKGFDCDGCYINGVSTWAQDHTNLFKDSENPGVDATISAVEGVTGLDINYWAMVNLRGFRNLVDAVGGVELNVRDRIPVGLPHDSFYRHIEPGKRKLDGEDTLWFARARHGSDDYSRMARQKCVMNAMVTQLSPAGVVRNFEKIAQASSAMISTNLPASELDTFIDLALKAKGGKISTVSFVPPMIRTSEPDVDLIQTRVVEAIDRSRGIKLAKKPDTVQADGDAPADGGTGGGADSTGSGAGSASAAAPKPPTTTTGGSLGSLKSGYAANEAEDLGSTC